MKPHTFKNKEMDAQIIDNYQMLITEMLAYDSNILVSSYSQYKHRKK